MTRLGLFRPPRVVASLHDLSCKGPGACSCRPIYVVGTEAEQDRPSGEQPIGYTSMVGVATTGDTMRAARIGATPPVRAARHSGVDE